MITLPIINIFTVINRFKNITGFEHRRYELTQVIANIRHFSIASHIVIALPTIAVAIVVALLRS